MILILTKKDLPDFNFRDNGRDSDTDSDSDDNWPRAHKTQKRPKINVKLATIVNSCAISTCNKNNNLHTDQSAEGVDTC